MKLNFNQTYYHVHDRFKYRFGLDLSRNEYRDLCLREDYISLLYKEDIRVYLIAFLYKNTLVHGYKDLVTDRILTVFKKNTIMTQDLNTILALFENGERRYDEDQTFKAAVDYLKAGLGVYAVLDHYVKEVNKLRAKLKGRESDPLSWPEKPNASEEVNKKPWSYD